MRKNSKKLFRVSLCALGAVGFGVTLPKQASMSTYSQTKSRVETMQYLDNEGYFASDFTTLADAQVAAADLNEQISEEGNTVLKNDGTLPLRKGAFVSVFGAYQNTMVGSSSNSGQTKSRIKTPVESLEAVGYKVNPTLASYYEDHKGSIGTEEYKFTSNVTNSLGLYDECGFVFLSRTGGEGSDLKLTTSEESDDGEHKNEISGKKHYLELTDSEEKLIELAKNTCKKVVVLLNTSNIMEIDGLKKDDKINAIMWIGRPGESGMKALGELVSGEINPSGHVVDTWYADFSLDPTWFNFGDNTQVNRTDVNALYYADGTVAGGGSGGGPNSSGFYGVDYEEGLYLGYRYYETRYYEIAKKLGADKANAWYDANVSYPFGYGLSYTSFKFDMGELYTDKALTEALGASVDGTKLASSKGHEAELKSFYVPVTVTNTGNRSGKEVVQVYVTAPYSANGIAKSFVTLVGYAKTGELQPGASEQVVVEVKFQDIASFDDEDVNNNGKKTYELDAGSYTIRAMENAHVKFKTSGSGIEVDMGEAYGQKSFTVTSTDDAAVVLGLDDYSGEEVEARFDGKFRTVRDAKAGFNKTNDDLMTVLDRDDLATDADVSYTADQASADTYAADASIPSFPRPQTTAGRTMNQDFYDDVYTMELYDADNTDAYKKYDDASVDGHDVYGDWAVTNNDIPSDWTQATTSGTNNTKLKAMSGKKLRNADGTITDEWTTFMNQLTWEEISRVVSNGGYCTADVDSINKVEGFDLDDPLDLDNSYAWTDEPTVAATFNVELGRKWGIIVGNLGMFKRTDGWYGPGMNTHRSPFGGRNCQYLSEDGMCAGIMAAAVVKGAQSRGLNCIVKHLALNEQETNRAGDCLFNFATEQAIREIYLKPFQMALQEGGASGAMTACVRIGIMSASADYAVNDEIVHQEWGWDGFLLTDGYTGVERPNPVDLMIRTSNDLPLGNAKGSLGTGIGPNTYDHITINVYDTAAADGSNKVAISRNDYMSGTWDSTLRGGKGGVKVGGETIEYYDKASHSKKEGSFTAVESPVQYYNARMIATRVLYTAANSQTNHNGIKMEKPSNEEEVWIDWNATSDLGTVAQGVEVSNVSVAPAAGVLDDRNTTSYEITDGELPEGLSISSDGSITGTATGLPGTYNFTVKLYADYWNTATADFTIKVSSAFELSNTDNATVGQDYYSAISSQTIVASADGKTTVKYAYDSGDLPDGLTVKENGDIEGKPTEAGTYTFVVAVTQSVTKESSGGGPGGGGDWGGWPGMPGGGGNSTTTTVYYYSITLTVDPDSTVDPEPQPEENYSEEIAALKAAVEELKKSGTDTSDLEKRIKALEDKSSSSTTTTDYSQDIADLKSEIEALKKNSSSGCGGSVIAATSAIGALGLVGAALLLKKKKEDK